VVQLQPVVLLEWQQLLLMHAITVLLLLLVCGGVCTASGTPSWCCNVFRTAKIKVKIQRSPCTSMCRRPQPANNPTLTPTPSTASRR
jgi:hypothetical protein